MKYITKLYTQINKRYFSSSCNFTRNINCNATCNATSNVTCKADYIWSPFSASLIAGSLFSIIIKESIKNDLLYMTRQNEEIIIRVKRLEEKA